MKAAISTNHMVHQKSHGAAIRKGLERHGIECEFVNGDRFAASADFHVTWGAQVKRPTIFELSDLESKPVLVMERAYLPDRMEWTSMGWGGLNNRAHFPKCPDDGERFEKHWPDLLKPWRRSNNGHVLVCGQVPGDSSVHGVDLGAWIQEVVETLSGEVVFRPHPVMIERNISIQYPIGASVSTHDTLAEDLIGCRLCITYNSNSGVEAVLAGIPTVCWDKGAMAWTMTTRSPWEKPLRPNRKAWAHHLAWCQWQREEIEDGTAWDHLKGYL